MLQEKVNSSKYILVAFLIFSALIGIKLLNMGSQSNPKNAEVVSNGFLQDDAKLTINNVTLDVEIADTDQKRARGLSGKEKIADGEGMLFTSTFSSYPVFWMNEMLFSLDFIWINKDLIVDITENVPAPLADTPQNELLKYSPKAPADQVLEVNAGYVAKNNIKIGDKVTVEKN